MVLRKIYALHKHGPHFVFLKSKNVQKRTDDRTLDVGSMNDRATPKYAEESALGVGSSITSAARDAPSARRVGSRYAYRVFT
ncbi:hypothetical protein SAMN02787142_0627 [Burkholderia sp. WP9]|nr:hypothetical protein SAMN02787142_0627 [Burkholderia sp. WP9]